MVVAVACYLLWSLITTIPGTLRDDRRSATAHGHLALEDGKHREGHVYQRHNGRSYIVVASHGISLVICRPHFLCSIEFMAHVPEFAMIWLFQWDILSHCLTCSSFSIPHVVFFPHTPTRFRNHCLTITGVSTFQAAKD